MVYLVKVQLRCITKVPGLFLLLLFAPLGISRVNILIARTEANGPKRPPLRWSPSLARAAHTWAAHLAATDHLQHSTGSGQGENLYCSLGQSDVSFSDAVISWVSEKPLYHGEHIPDGDFESYGHYTQIIWPSTREVGMGMARSASGWTYIVARYSPPHFL